MHTAVLIFPHQLFEKHPALTKDGSVYLIEECLFFKLYKFHKQKLVFHRASMKFYEKYLINKKFKVKYVESGGELSDIRKLIIQLKKEGLSELHFAEVVDNWLEKRITETAKSNSIKIKVYDSPGFINSREEIKKHFNGEKNYSQTSFYIQQRKKLNLLLDEEGKPIGNKWTFDSENRKKYPANKIPPQITFPKQNEFIKEATKYVNNNFQQNYGSINEEFIYPVTFDESKDWFNQFLKKRFKEFGPYEDAIVAEESILHHSLLSPLLNSGLLTPEYVVNKTIAFAERNKIPINSSEGFLRQIFGWREFIRGMYQVAGTKQRTTNYW